MWHADWLVRGLDFSDPGGEPWHWWPGPDGLCPRPESDLPDQAGVLLAAYFVW
jgi:hypothetical protein